MSELVRVCDDVWMAEDHDLRLPGGVYFGARMTVVRLKDGRLVVYSPIALSDELATQVEALGDVAVVMAPNLFHNMFLASASARFPDARVLGPKGLELKLPELQIHGDASDVGALSDELEAFGVEGAPGVRETVLYHAPSSSLLVADLFFNIVEPRTFATGMVLRAVGAHRRFATSRSWKVLFVKDRAAARAAAERILDRPFTRVIMGHGDVAESPDVRQLARAELAWLGLHQASSAA